MINMKNVTIMLATLLARLAHYIYATTRGANNPPLIDKVNGYVHTKQHQSIQEHLETLP